MKKLILASAFALMATPALFAQSDNSFSMQIELKNGTKITLGPNDLKNISFVDGAIKIEGNTIEDLRMAIAKAEANTKNMVAEQRYDLDDLKKEAAELQAMIDYLSDKVAKLENAGGGSGNTEDITALQAAIATLQSELAKVQSSEMATKTDVAATNEKINNIQAMVKATEAAIMDLQEAVKGLSSGSSGSGFVGNEERIKLLEEAVNNLKADMKNLSNIEQVKQLQDQIYNLQAMVNVVATNSTGNQALADELKVKMTAVEAAMANLNNNVTANQDAINQIKMESVDAKNRIAELQKQLNEVRESGAGDTRALEKEINSLKAKTDDMVAQLAALKADLQGQNAQTANDLKELQAKLKDEAELRIKGDAMNEQMIKELTKVFEDKLDAIDEKHEAEEKKLEDKQEEVGETLKMFMRFVQENVPFNESFEDWLKKQGQQ